MNGHELEEHTGEVRLRLEAADWPGLFTEAARALAELMTGAPDVKPPAGQPVELTVHAPDRAALLVEWLNELVFLSETRKEVLGEATVVSATANEVVATVRGYEPAVLKTAVKAATLHEARVDQRDGRWHATVVLDV